MSDFENLARRVRALESRESIRQLVADYATYLDAKDLEAVAALFTEDALVGDEVGRAAKLRSLTRHHGAPGRFGTTIHLNAGHAIRLDDDDDDHATGVLYCRAEHEIGGRWVIAVIQYWDDYARRDERWLFRSRGVRAYYVVDILERPNDEPIKEKLTHFGLLEHAELPGAWSSWHPFWAAQGRDPHTPAPAPGG